MAIWDLATFPQNGWKKEGKKGHANYGSQKPQIGFKKNEIAASCAKVWVFQIQFMYVLHDPIPYLIVAPHPQTQKSYLLLFFDTQAHFHSFLSIRRPSYFVLESSTAHINATLLLTLFFSTEIPPATFSQNEWAPGRSVS